MKTDYEWRGRIAAAREAATYFDFDAPIGDISERGRKLRLTWVRHARTILEALGPLIDADHVKTIRGRVEVDPD